MSSKKEAFELLMQQVIAFIERFKYIDKAIESLCKTMCKKAISDSEFDEILKLYNNTSQMFMKALELIDNIMDKFPQELSLDELEMLEAYRRLPDAERFIYKAKLKELFRS